jgi:uncharacterized protein (DUF4213/DUF364 family)
VSDAVTEELLSVAARAAAAFELPPVRALHLPPEFARGTKDGEFCALELADGSLGLSYVLLDDTVERLLATGPGEGLAGAPALAVAARCRSADPSARALGFAAINAISQHLFRRARYEPPAAADSIGGLDPRPGERIAMVGWFPGLARRIVERGASLVVVELDASFAGEKDGYRVTLDRGELANRDKVLSTTTLLLNGTLEAVLAECAGARAIALVGPGGGFVPDPLFARGVTTVGGTAIRDRDAFVAALAHGRPWGELARKYVIARDSYPGADALIARAA